MSRKTMQKTDTRSLMELGHEIAPLFALTAKAMRAKTVADSQKAHDERREAMAKFSNRARGYAVLALELLMSESRDNMPADFAQGAR